VDILVELDKKFKTLVTDRLDQRSRNAVLTQEDPATMSDMEQLKIRKSILQLVYGKTVRA
jgi:hypothetical protein